MAVEWHCQTGYRGDLQYIKVRVAGRSYKIYGDKNENVWIETEDQHPRTMAHMQDAIRVMDELADIIRGSKSVRDIMDKYKEKVWTEVYNVKKKRDLS